MKLANANSIRAGLMSELSEFFATKGEDVGAIASNTLNFPIVAEDGEEGWVEVIVKVPKGTKDEEYDGYGRREDYKIAAVDRAEKKAAAEAAKQKKIAKDEARRKAKAES